MSYVYLSIMNIIDYWYDTYICQIAMEYCEFWGFNPEIAPKYIYSTCIALIFLGWTANWF